MEHTNADALKEFDIQHLPDLDTVTLGALEMLGTAELPSVSFDTHKRPLVVGSGNAFATGRLLFSDADAVFADEGTYQDALETIPGIDGVVLVSASGGKHAIGIAEDVRQKGLPILLLTNNPDAPAKEYIDASHMHVFPRNREPYTYNTSTYMGMILSKTKEDPENIYTHIMGEVAGSIPENFGEYDSFYFIVPPEFNAMREMFLTKFSELFGARVSGRVFTVEQTKHAKTVVPSEKEYFISFGEENTTFGDERARLHVPLPPNAGYAAMMAVGYYVIGRIQKQHPPYFKDNIGTYVEKASTLFGQTITPIVE